MTKIFFSRLLSTPFECEESMLAVPGPGLKEPLSRSALLDIQTRLALPVSTLGVRSKAFRSSGNQSLVLWSIALLWYEV